MVWPNFERFSGLDDPLLWTATSYCPSVALRIESIGVTDNWPAGDPSLLRVGDGLDELELAQPVTTVEATEQAAGEHLSVVH